MRNHMVPAFMVLALLTGCSDSGKSGSSASSTAGADTKPPATGATLAPGETLPGGVQICTVVNAVDVTAAFGAQAADGTPIEDANRNGCTWLLADKQVVVVGLTAWTTEAEAAAKELNTEVDVINGVGERAWFGMSSLHVKQGALDLVVVTTVNDLDGAIALAKALLPRL